MVSQGILGTKVSESICLKIELEFNLIFGIFLMFFILHVIRLKMP